MEVGFIALDTHADMLYCSCTIQSLSDVFDFRDYGKIKSSSDMKCFSVYLRSVDEVKSEPDGENNRLSLLSQVSSLFSQTLNNRFKLALNLHPFFPI